MQKAKIAIAAVGLTSALAFAAAGVLKDHPIVVMPAAAATTTTGTDTSGYMPLSFATGGNGYTPFLRLGNAAAVSSTFTILVAADNGTVGATPVVVTVPSNGLSTQQISALVTASGVTLSTPGRGTVYVKSDQAGKGAVAQVLFVNPGGALSTETHCVYDSTLTYDPTVGKTFFGITGPAFSAVFPSFLQITNPDSTARVVTGSFYDPSGAHIDELYTSTVPANGSILLPLTQSSGQSLADPNNPSAATALPGLASARDFVNLVIRTGDSSALTAVVNPIVVSPGGTISSISEFCPVNPTHGGGAVSPSGS